MSKLVDATVSILEEMKKSWEQKLQESIEEIKGARDINKIINKLESIHQRQTTSTIV